MKKASVFYDSWHGHTAKIAERIAARLECHEFETSTYCIRGLEPVPVASNDVVVFVAPIHAGNHSKFARRFVRNYRLALGSASTLFLSVSLSAAGTPAQKDDAQRVLEEFLEETQWAPDRTEIVAGDLAYRRYTWPTRWLMRFISWRAGGDTEIGRNHVYTDWALLTEQLDEFIGTRFSATQEVANLRT